MDNKIDAYKEWYKAINGRYPTKEQIKMWKEDFNRR